MLTLSWPKLPLSCPYVDPMFAYVGRRNALPHSSDRNGGGGDGVGTGWGRGGDGVGTGSPQAGAAAGAASLPSVTTEGLWQGHGLGLGPAPGFKGYRPCRRPQHLGGGGQSVRLKQLQFIGWLGITVYWMVGYTDNSGNVEVIDAEGLC